MSRGEPIRDSVEYVVCLLTLISFICLVPSAGRLSPPRRTSQLRTNFSSGYFRNLWSRLDFAGKPLKSCVDVLPIGIVEIWNLNGTNRVNPSHLPELF